jgi:hypothetical protein
MKQINENITLEDTQNGDKVGRASKSTVIAMLLDFVSVGNFLCL